MLIQIQSGSGPIYQQIVDQIRFRIVAGQLRSGEELPTIRGLAESLQVNPNTIARAYRELEHEGLVEKRRTTGTFVSENSGSKSPARRRRLLTPEIDKLLILAGHLGVAKEELNELIQTRQKVIERRGKQQ
ncbi:GntR family transcriptional regulator [Roseiconus nitratireducens]|uniref:GntR family transcriptional regulator n=1 Tax=Roseiconus nitratireducens TaxID=2605748 RepID=A0A5M6DCA5_9BACT|nr:GntR family transcriptional regulator [Roseiconus nitratireducens]KAA5545188.1 GntR family transcriptional regulator [Roseiconus nitratireducens]